MDREKIKQLLVAAESHLAFARSGLIIAAQTPAIADLPGAGRHLALFRDIAGSLGFVEIADLAAETEIALRDTVSPVAALDRVAAIEEAIFKLPLGSPDFAFELDELIADPLRDIGGQSDRPRNDDHKHFKVDDETLDIFRTEADELLTNIASGLQSLIAAPANQNALWEIRRSVHTFKGAAGIVGLASAAEVAHRMEDLLDRLVGERREAAPEAITFLDLSASRLDAIVRYRDLDGDDPALISSYEEAVAALDIPLIEGPAALERPNEEEPAARSSKPSSTSRIVRVSLDRLDELISISHGLQAARSALTEALWVGDQNKFRRIFAAQRTLADELHAKLLSVRMVKFGNLETRLSRAVHATCIDEGKKASLMLENGEVEIDTQIIDAFIEPLLHLLKNAVVHGIEPPEKRRLLSKPESGTIIVRVEIEGDELFLTVADDGGGVSISKIRDKAAALGLLSMDSSPTDEQMIARIFDRGLTTAPEININAGRGVGMSIVKESIEARGGSVEVATIPQCGTTFTLRMPATLTNPAGKPPLKFSKTDGETPLVLVVDDSPSIRQQTSKVIVEYGYRVLTAGDGAEALELLLSGSYEPNLILSDIEMPQMDGWAFLEYVKTDAHFGHIPVVMISSLSAGEHQTRALDLGASGYLVKPFAAADLESILSELESGVVV